MIKEKILEALKNRAPMKKEAIAKLFDIKNKEKKDFYKILDKLVDEEKLYLIKDKYVLVDNEKYRQGILQGNEKGFGFLLQDGEDVFIAKKNINGALNGDEVLVKISKESKGDSIEGRVVEILKRANETIVGIYQKSKKFGFVLPDESKIAFDVFIKNSDSLDAKDGQKVLVKIKKWPEKDKNPEGEVISVFGYPKEKGVDILSIAAAMNLEMEFSQAALDLAKKLPDKVSEEEIVKRLDLRDKTTFTIDGEDSKDFDDAVSIEKLENGNYLLGVHIADVAHYVKNGDEIDKEAFKRGNSVYLIDKVIPMLPVELSNGICSLNEGVDRLCLSVLMEINKNGSVKDQKIVETVINSNKRLVYKNVSDFIENGRVDESIKGLEEDLKLMDELAEILRKKRHDRGSIDFDFPESKITVDENGRPINVEVAERRIANQIIEEFMIISNEVVSEQFYWMHLPFLYRIHEEPSEEKIEALNAVIRHLGLKLSTQNLSSRDVQKLIEEVKGKDEEVFVSGLVLRSMKKAKYSENNYIHFGLAAKYYSHFTAPIRRYSDISIHRIIKDYLNNSLGQKKIKYYEAMMPVIADRTSKTEIQAMEAERQVESVKFAEYMESKIGEEYKGVISSITSFGMFVQLANTIEGFVSYSSLNDFYTFNEDLYEAQAQDSNNTFHIGDKVKIRVVAADSIKGNIDFEIIE